MPIELECAGCGSRYRVSDRAAKKRVRCQCGRMMGGPPPAAKAADSPGGPIESTPPEVSNPRPDAVSAPVPVPDTSLVAIYRRVREGIARKNLPMREVVALACIGYGGLMALLLLAGVPALGPAVLIPFLDLLARPACAVFVAVSGVLILKRHPHATALVGLSTVLLCFMPICGEVVRAFVLMSAVRPGALLLLLLRAAVVYPIPVWIMVWAVREETAKQEAERDDPY